MPLDGSARVDTSPVGASHELGSASAVASLNGDLSDLLEPTSFAMHSPSSGSPRNVKGWIVGAGDRLHCYTPYCMGVDILGPADAAISDVI